MNQFESKTPNQKNYRDIYLLREDGWTVNNQRDKEIYATIKGLIAKYAGNGKRLSLLDIGCGKMPLTLPIAHEFENIRVVGIEWALTEVLEIYRDFEIEVTSTPNVSVIKADFMSFHSIPRFDIVVDFGMFQHLTSDDWSKYVERISLLIKNKGYYILYAYHSSDRQWGKERVGGYSNHIGRLPKILKNQFHDFEPIQHLERGEKQKGIDMNAHFYSYYHNIDSIKKIFKGTFSKIHEIYLSKGQPVVAVYLMTTF